MDQGNDIALTIDTGHVHRIAERCGVPRHVITGVIKGDVASPCGRIRLRQQTSHRDSSVGWISNVVVTVRESLLRGLDEQMVIRR